MGEERAIPEGMVPWEGEYAVEVPAPADWDGGPVMFADGSVDSGQEWDWGNGHLGGTIIAYTPRKPALAKPNPSAFPADEIARLRELLAKATPGPLAYEILPSDDAERAGPKSEWSTLYIGPEGDCEFQGTVDHTIFEGGFAHGPEDGDPDSDAALWVEAVNALPRLLDALTALSGVPEGSGEALARRFHETYERLAPSFGYETRADTKVFDPDSLNGRLMIAVCADLAASPTIPSSLVGGG